MTWLYRLDVNISLCFKSLLSYCSSIVDDWSANLLCYKSYTMKDSQPRVNNEGSHFRSYSALAKYKLYLFMSNDWSHSDFPHVNHTWSTVNDGQPITFREWRLTLHVIFRAC